jgi:predicted DCC family thiol-disulfide oxidoreductase YuxK
VLVIFDDTCRMCTRSVRFVRAFDWLRRFEYAGFSEAAMQHPEVAASSLDDGLRARFPDGSMTVGIDAVRSIMVRTPLGALVGWTLYVPPIRAVARRVYCEIARRRHTSCRLVPRG